MRPFPTISMKGRVCNIGLLLTMVSITPVRRTSLESFAASARVSAMSIYLLCAYAEEIIERLFCTGKRHLSARQGRAIDR